MYADVLRPMVEDTIVTLNDELKKESNILVEGANATMLDIDFGKKRNCYLLVPYLIEM